MQGLAIPNTPPAVENTFWSFLDEPSRTAFERKGVHKRLRRDEQLMHEGDPSNTVFVVMRGFLRLEKTTVDGLKSVIGMKRAGELVGDIEVFADGPRLYTATATMPCLVLAINSNDFTSLTMNIMIAKALLKQNALTQRAYLRAGRGFGPGGARRQIVNALLDLAFSLGNSPQAREVELLVRQADIAAMCGVSERTAATAIAHLRARGLLTTGYGRLVIASLRALADLYDRAPTRRELHTLNT